MKRDYVRTIGRSICMIPFIVVIGGTLTSYLEEYEKSLLMLIRNLILFGTWDSMYPHEGFHPVHIAQTVRDTALEVLEGKHEHSFTRTAEELKLIKIADYFINRAEERSNGASRFYVWSYDFDWPVYNLSAPWISGMAQGHVIEVMLAAYELTGEEQYLQTARLAAEALAVPIELGGVAIEVDDGLWFEEYAKPGARPSYVLNGHMFALHALSYLSLRDKQYHWVFEKGLNALRTLLPRFDAGIWSFYDLTGIPANRKYQQIHVEQLWDLYKRTNDKIFKDYARKFQFQLWLPVSAFYRLVMYPDRFLVVIFLINSMVVGFCGLIVWPRVKRKKSAC